MSEVLSLTKPRTRVMWSAEERTEWLRLFDQSGQTAAEFCRDNDLPQATLSCWLRQAQEPPPAEPSLVEIPRETLSAAPVVMPVSTAAVSVMLPSGLRFDVPVGIDTAWFGQLLQSLIDAKV